MCMAIESESGAATDPTKHYDSAAAADDRLFLYGKCTFWTICSILITIFILHIYRWRHCNAHIRHELPILIQPSSKYGIETSIKNCPQSAWNVEKTNEVANEYFRGKIVERIFDLRQLELWRSDGEGKTERDRVSNLKRFFVIYQRG